MPRDGARIASNQRSLEPPGEVLGISCYRLDASQLVFTSMWTYKTFWIHLDGGYVWMPRSNLNAWDSAKTRRGGSRTDWPPWRWTIWEFHLSVTLLDPCGTSGDILRHLEISDPSCILEPWISNACRRLRGPSIQRLYSTVCMRVRNKNFDPEQYERHMFDQFN